MADARVMAVRAAVLALALAAAGGGAACGRAGAAPDQASGLTPPAGWQPMPAIAAAARGAIKGAEVEGAEAWGEPAMGCYAVWLAIRATGGAKAIAEQVVSGFAAAGSAAPMIVKDVAAPSGDEGVLTLAFERGDHRGRLRARIGGERTATLACFANQREPRACEAACTTFLGALP
jgi:hypothetical protein